MEKISSDANHKNISEKVFSFTFFIEYKPIYCTVWVILKQIFRLKRLNHKTL